MCRMFGVLSLAYVAIFMITVVHSSEDRTSMGIVDFMGKGKKRWLILNMAMPGISFIIMLILPAHFFSKIKSQLDANVGRTFGHNALKRLSFIFLPVMFTLGVISTLLMALAVISVKNLAIGVVLLIVAVSQAVSRLFSVAAAPSPLVFHPRAELLPGPALPAPWPASGPLLSPWARSDNDATISD